MANDYNPKWSAQQKANYYSLATIKEHLQMYEDMSAYDGNEVNGYDMLSIAIAAGKLDLVQYLLKHGCTVDHYDSHGVTPLIVAIKYRQHHIINFLLEQGAIKDKATTDNQSVASLAYASGDKEIMKLFPKPKATRLSLELTKDESLELSMEKLSFTINTKAKLMKHFGFVNKEKSYVIVLDFHASTFIKHLIKNIDHATIKKVKLGWHYDFFRLALECDKPYTYKLKHTDEGISITVKE
jgi:hypothetical protein